MKAPTAKLVTIGAERELFGCLMIAANVRNINLKEILRCELSPIPLSLTHPDDSLPKSTFATNLESRVNVCPKLQKFKGSTIHLIDGMALVQVLR